jgi:transposase
MDLSETYRQIVRQYFPNAMIVADRFHVVRLVNQHFLKLWQQQDPVGRKNRGLLSPDAPPPLESGRWPERKPGSLPHGYSLVLFADPQTL